MFSVLRLQFLKKRALQGLNTGAQIYQDATPFPGLREVHLGVEAGAWRPPRGNEKAGEAQAPGTLERKRLSHAGGRNAALSDHPTPARAHGSHSLLRCPAVILRVGTFRAVGNN